MASDAKKEPDEKIVDTVNDKDVVASIQYDISSYGADYDVEGLVKRLQRGDILIPTFQRNYIWTQREASRFIESLLLGLPIPGIFLVREPNTNKLLVIDGQQRLKSLQFFYEGYFRPKETDTKRTVFKLVDVQSKFEGRTYETLDESDKIRLNDSLIHAVIIKQESPENDDTSIYHIFDRLNSEGRRLAPQELRTAVYHGLFIELLKELNEYPAWRKIYGRVNSRLKDQELILRFFAFYYSRNNYFRPFHEFLTKFCSTHQNASNTELAEMRELFTQTIDLVWKCIGQKAFRIGRAVNAAVFDSVMCGVAELISKQPDVDCLSLQRVYDELLADDKYKNLVSGVTSVESNIRDRFDIAINRLSKL